MAFLDLFNRNVATRLAITRQVTDPTTGKQVSSAISIFDAVVEETHSSSLDVTEFPIEDGSIINDHAIVQPVELTIRGITSNHPIELFDLANLTAFGFGAAAGIGGELLASQAVDLPGVGLFGGKSFPLNRTVAQAVGAATVLGPAFANDSSIITDAQGNLLPAPNRSNKAYQALRGIQIARELVSITSGIRQYSNMLWIDINVVRNAQNSLSVVADCTFREIQIATTSTATINLAGAGFPKNNSADVDEQGRKETELAQPNVTDITSEFFESGIPIAGVAPGAP